jgi:hypothetical protein
MGKSNISPEIIQWLQMDRWKILKYKNHSPISYSCSWWILFNHNALMEKKQQFRVKPNGLGKSSSKNLKIKKQLMWINGRISLHGPIPKKRYNKPIKTTLMFLQLYMSNYRSSDRKRKQLKIKRIGNYK